MDRFIRSRRTIRSSTGRRNARRIAIRNFVDRVGRARRMRRLAIGGEWSRARRARIRRHNVLLFNRSRLPNTMRVLEHPRLMDYIEDFNRPKDLQRYN